MTEAKGENNTSGRQKNLVALSIDVTYSISTMDTLRNGIYCGQQTITIVRCPRALNELNWLGIVNLFSRRLL